MKAIVITKPGGPEVLEWREVDDPVPSESEVLVRVHATALNRADLLQRMGKYPAPTGVPSDIPGLEFAGVVEAVGSSQSEWKPGDRVMGLLGGGGYAEKIVTDEHMLLPIPDGMSFTNAAAIPEAFLTAFDAMFLQLEVSSMDDLLIHAVASGVGTAALQMARLLNINTIGTSRSAEKLEQMKELGLNIAIDTSREDFAEVVKSRVKGADAILDLVGAKYLKQNLDALAPRGRMVLVGMVGGSKAEVDLGVILSKRLTIMGTVLRSRSLEEKVALNMDFRKTMLDYFKTRELRPIVDRVMPIQEAAEAHRAMEANANVGKIVLEVG